MTARGLAVLAAVALAACGAPARDAPPRNLVVIVLDALRASAVGAYGYARATTPELDAFAAGGLRFEQAYAPASYTLASVSSMLTGHSPAAHGVVSLESNVLPPRFETLAETLERAGFATACFSSNPHVTAEGGFDQGFGEFRHYERGRFDYHTIPTALGKDALAFWEAHPERRKLLWLHLLPPHQPYDAPPPHGELFGAGETQRELGMTEWLVAADRAGTVRPGSPQALAIRARYDAGVHYADAFAGEVLARLEKLGALADSAVCIVSDHGEAFGEHGRLLHGSTVFEEMVRVPLLLSWPGAEPGVVRDLVSTADLAPTLAELLDVGFAEGRSFLGAVRGGTPGGRGAPEVPAGPALSRSVGNQPVWALRTERFALLEQKSTGRRLLFDRGADPGETRDLLRPAANGGGDVAEARARASEIAGELSGELARRLAEDRRAGRGTRLSSDAHRDAVEDLGYADEETAELPEEASEDRSRED